MMDHKTYVIREVCIACTHSSDNGHALTCRHRTVLVHGWCNQWKQGSRYAKPTEENAQTKIDLQNRLHKAEKKLKEQEQKYLQVLQKNSVREYKSCGKKVAFSSKDVADNRARQAGQRVYHCPHCKKWHLTRKEGL